MSALYASAAEAHRAPRLKKSGSAISASIFASSASAAAISPSSRATFFLMAEISALRLAASALRSLKEEAGFLAAGEFFRFRRPYAFIFSMYEVMLPGYARNPDGPSSYTLSTIGSRNALSWLTIRYVPR